MSELATPQSMHPNDEPYGGLRRLPYFLISMAVQIGISIGAAMLVPSMASGSGMSPVVAGVLVLLTLVVALYLTALRFRNQGASPWWALAMLVPILNIYVTIRAIAFPEGYVDTGKIDRAGWIIIIVAIVLTVLMILGTTMAMPGLIEAAQESAAG